MNRILVLITLFDVYPPVSNGINIMLSLFILARDYILYLLSHKGTCG